MAVRTFTMPTGLDNALASADKQNEAATTEPKRSEEAAKETTDGFTKKEQEPLKESKNPDSKPGITFAAQDKLPKLPIPDLESSCKKYLAALDPLQTARERADTESAVHEFLRVDGPDLQERLKKYATGKSSYIEQFCKGQPDLGSAGCRSLQRSILELTSIRVRLLPQL